MASDKVQAKPPTVSKLFLVQYALTQPRFTKADVLVLAILIEYHNWNYGYAWPSVETIATVAKLERRTIQKCLGRLAEGGVLRILRGGGRNRSSRYYVPLEAFDSSPFRDAIRNASVARSGSGSSIDGQKGERPRGKERTAARETANCRTPEPILGNPPDWRPSATAASPNGDAVMPTTLDASCIGQFQRWWNENKHSMGMDRGELEDCLLRLDEFIEDHPPYEFREGGWASRLRDEIADYLEDHGS